MRLRLLFAFFATLALGLSSCEENTVEPLRYGAVEGTVLDARTNRPLVNVSISTNPATGSYITDGLGHFKIDQVPTGQISVTARKADYNSITATLTINEGQNTPVSIQLDKPAAATTPGAPSRPDPAIGSTNQAAELTLSWHPTNAAKGDSLRYDVVLYEGNNVNQRNLLTNSKDTTVLATNLLYNTTYYWQVTVRNPAGAIARSTVWNFQTRALPTNRYLYARTANGNTDIYSSSATGSDLLRLTSAITVETAPQLSPNGDLIAYSSNASGQFQLYTMNRDGSNQRRITTLSAEGYSNAGIGYRWSPDGAQLLYAHYDQLYRINRDGTGLTLLATAPTGRHFRECDWTAQNGGRLVVQTIGALPFDAELYLYDVNGTNPTLLVGNLPGRLDSPSFSIDGRSVVYSRDVAGFNDITGRQLDAHIFTQRLDGSSTTDVSSGTGSNTKALGTNDITPRYTPDGFHLIFVNRANDDLSQPDVLTVDLDGRNRTKVFTNAFWPDYK